MTASKYSAPTTGSQAIESILPGLDSLGISLSAPQQADLACFCDELIKWNRSFNLVSRQDIQRLGTRHIFDSLTGATLFPPAQEKSAQPVQRLVLDVGSGAGLPGIPLAIWRPDFTYVLLDRSARRTRFLQHIKTRLDLAHVEILCEDVTSDKVAQTYTGHRSSPGENEVNEGGFNVIVARAVAPVERLWAMTGHLLAPGGRLLVYESVEADPGPGEIVPVERRLNIGAQVVCQRHNFAVASENIHAILQVWEDRSDPARD